MSLCFSSPISTGSWRTVTRSAPWSMKAGQSLSWARTPIALGILKTPGRIGADIAVGEGQPLGMPLSFGGPYLGYMSTTKAWSESFRDVSWEKPRTAEGRRAFVLTLQAREQHIRREKSQQQHLFQRSAVRPDRIRVLKRDGEGRASGKAARQCTSKAHFLQGKLSEAGLTLKYEKPFFHEFVTCTPIPAGEILDKLEEEGILGGLLSVKKKFSGVLRRKTPGRRWRKWQCW